MKKEPKKQIRIQRGNSKLGKAMNISLPPGITCRKNAPCFTEGCYDVKFCRLRPAVKAARTINYKTLQADRDRYFALIHAHVTIEAPKLFRWHVGGDIPDIDYLYRMVALAEANPETRFLAFTKQYELLLEARLWEREPVDNLSIVVSGWPGLRVPVELFEYYPTAWMYDPSIKLYYIPKNATQCDGGCDKCGLCWNMKPGESVYFDKH